MRPITVATANVRKELKGSNVTKAVHAAAPCDIALWQEVETQAHANTVASLPGFSTYWPGHVSRGRPNVNAANATPISFNHNRFELMYGGRRTAIPGVAKISPTRDTIWVVLRDRQTHQWGWAVDIHTISGIDKHTNRVKGWGNRTRKMMWNVHMRQVRNVVKMLQHNHPHAVFGVVGGDFNHPQKFGKAVIGVSTHYAAHPTHGGVHGSWFDLIGTNNHVRSIYRRTNTPSDHDVLVAVID